MKNVYIHLVLGAVLVTGTGAIAMDVSPKKPTAGDIAENAQKSNTKKRKHSDPENNKKVPRPNINTPTRKESVSSQQNKMLVQEDHYNKAKKNFQATGQGNLKPKKLFQEQ